jgi:hypothetical protein
MLKLISDSQIYQYVKFWTTNKEKARNIYHTNVDFVERNGITIPNSLDILLQTIPKERLGVEVVVREDNEQEIIEEIIPFCQEEEIKCFLEPIIQVKWASHIRHPSIEAQQKIRDVMAIFEDGKYCNDRAARDLVINVDTLAPCIVFQSLDRYKIINREGQVKDASELFRLFHDVAYRDMRHVFTGETCACKKILSGELTWEDTCSDKE